MLTSTLPVLPPFFLTITLNNNFALAFYYRGIIRALGGNTKQAITDFDRAIRIDPKQATAYYNRGVAQLS